MLGIEKSALDQYVGGRFGHARMLSAHDSADIVDLAVVGDHRHRWIQA